jgi:hypothetical protein
MRVKIKMHRGAIKQLERAQIIALEQTAEAVKTDVIAANVMPFGDGEYEEVREYGKRGQFAKNGREYKGRMVKKTTRSGGTLQNESTSIDASLSRYGHVTISSDTPYARRLYFHPEYKFNKNNNPHAGGRWFDPWIDGKKKMFAINAFRILYKKLTGV